MQRRTVEIFESIDIHSQLLHESHPIVEVMFWAAEDSTGDITRCGQTADPPPGLSHQPHVVLKQARVNELMTEKMKEINGQDVDYNSNVLHVACNKDKMNDPEAYPITCLVEKDGVKETSQAKYLLVSTMKIYVRSLSDLDQGCDGAHSTTRHSLNFNMEGDSTDAVWGVMDGEHPEQR